VVLASGDETNGQLFERHDESATPLLLVTENDRLEDNWRSTSTTDFAINTVRAGLMCGSTATMGSTCDVCLFVCLFVCLYAMVCLMSHMMSHVFV
jgi:hypothetical protein